MLSIEDIAKSSIDITKYHGAAATEEISRTLQIMKPKKEWFVTCHPDPAYTHFAGVFVLQDEVSGLSPAKYLVTENVTRELGSLVKLSQLVLAKTNHGMRFIWEAPTPVDPTSTGCAYIKSHLTALKLASSKWVRMQADTNIKDYKIFVWKNEPGASQAHPEISWEDNEPPLVEYLQKSFEGRFIDNPDHPIVKHFLQI